MHSLGSACCDGTAPNAVSQPVRACYFFDGNAEARTPHKTPASPAMPSPTFADGSAFRCFGLVHLSKKAQ